MEILFLLYVCPQVVLLRKSNIALFALRFTFGHIGGDTFEAVTEVSTWLCRQGTIFWTLLRKFCHFYLCSQIVRLDEYNIDLFAFGISFGPIGGKYL